MRYLDKIEECGGLAARMALLELAKNNEANLNRMLTRLILKWKWVEEIEHDGRKSYKMTERGDHLHKALKDHGDLDELIEELSSNKLLSDSAKILPD